MNIGITSKQIEITQLMRDKIESEFKKIQKNNVPIMKVHVIISKEKEGIAVEAAMNVQNSPVFAKAINADFYTATSMMCKKLKSSLSKKTSRSSDKNTKNHGKDQCREGTISGVVDDIPEVDDTPEDFQ